jgi:universal stress protein A
MKRISKILVPVDFSVGSKGAWELAHSLAETLHGSVSIELLHVWEGEETKLPDLTLSTDKRGTASRLLAEARAHGMSLEHAARFLEALENDGIEIVARMRGGDVAETIVRTATEGGFDLVVIGTRGRTGLAHALLGSVAETVVRMSTVPVLTAHVVPAPMAAAAG